MREILFKAKVKNWRELPKGKWWVEGYYFPGRTIGKNIDNVYAFIRDLNGENHWVDPETVCQYTEIIDKAKKKIFEGDIVDYEDEAPGQYEYHDSLIINRGVIIYSEGCFYWTNAVSANLQDYVYKGVADCEVIGNIFDNPELLEVSEA